MGRTSSAPGELPAEDRRWTRRDSLAAAAPHFALEAEGVAPRPAGAAASRLRPCPASSRTGAEVGRMGAGGLRTCLRRGADARARGGWREERPREPLISAGLGAEGRGRGARNFAPPPGPLACSGSAAAPDTLGASTALFAAGSTPAGAGSALRTFSSLTVLPSDRDTAADSKETRSPRTCARRRLDDIPVQRSPEPASRSLSSD